MRRFTAAGVWLVLVCLSITTFAAEPADQLLGHWPLTQDGNDVSAHKRHGVNHSVTFGTAGERRAALFNGRMSYLEVPADLSPKLAVQDFSISVWMRASDADDDVPGDVLSQYDAKTRRGFQLSLKTSSGVTFNQPNTRNLQFGIDQNRESEWVDCGKPGNALLAFSMIAHDGHLYAATCEPGEKESGHVYRYAGGKTWEDCGSPDASNTVCSLATYKGQLYVGTGKYRVAGSALSESPNTTLGGRVFRFEAPNRWVASGQLPGVEAVGGLTVYKNRLYATSLYKPAAFFRYEKGETWTVLPVPDGKRVETLGVYNGDLYATSYDGGLVFRFNGEKWEACGQLGENTQTYSFIAYQGRLFCGTWPSGSVYRFEEPGRWTDSGRLGSELEVMGMLVHNGRFMAGTLPLAEVYTYEGDATWKKTARLDHTPDVKYRRAWTMAEYQGALFCSTLPSGMIYSYRAGQMASVDRSLPTDWQHVVAVKTKDRLRIYQNGKLAAERQDASIADYDITSATALRFGLGENDAFYGALTDLRLYGRALDEKEVTSLAAPGESATKR